MMKDFEQWLDDYRISHGVERTSNSKVGLKDLLERAKINERVPKWSELYTSKKGNGTAIGRILQGLKDYHKEICEISSVIEKTIKEVPPHEEEEEGNGQSEEDGESDYEAVSGSSDEYYSDTFNSIPEAIKERKHISDDFIKLEEPHEIQNLMVEVHKKVPALKNSLWAMFPLMVMVLCLRYLLFMERMKQTGNNPVAPKPDLTDKHGNQKETVILTWNTLKTSFMNKSGVGPIVGGIIRMNVGAFCLQEITKVTGAKACSQLLEALPSGWKMHIGQPCAPSDERKSHTSQLNAIFFSPEWKVVDQPGAIHSFTEFFHPPLLVVMEHVTMKLPTIALVSMHTSPTHITSEHGPEKGTFEDEVRFVLEMVRQHLNENKFNLKEVSIILAGDFNCAPKLAGMCTTGDLKSSKHGRSLDGFSVSNNGRLRTEVTVGDEEFSHLSDHQSVRLIVSPK